MKTRLAIALLLVALPSLVDLACNLFGKNTAIFMSSFNGAWTAAGVFICLYMELVVTKVLAESDEKLTQMSSKLNGAFATVKMIPDVEFYGSFLASITRAKKYVWICYFQASPPNIGMDEDKRRYYAGLSEEIKRKKVRFRRIILDTEENRKWADEMMSELEVSRCTNIELYLLKQGAKALEQYYAASIQIIDDKYVWLVALGEHAASDGYRDLYIDSEDAAVMMKKYYERLVQLSEPIFRDGKRIEEEKTIKRRTTALPASVVTPASSDSGVK